MTTRTKYGIGAFLGSTLNRPGCQAAPRIGGERSSKQEGKRTDEQQHVEVQWLSLPSLRWVSSFLG